MHRSIVGEKDECYRRSLREKDASDPYRLRWHKVREQWISICENIRSRDFFSRRLTRDPRAVKGFWLDLDNRRLGGCRAKIDNFYFEVRHDNAS
jgi:hypothetical protein